MFETATQHMIEQYFCHPFYWKVDGKIYFSVYELMSLVKGLGGLEKTKKALDGFRERGREAGLGELHINAWCIWKQLRMCLDK